jgi:hypothetical protein
LGRSDCRQSIGTFGETIIIDNILGLETSVLIAAFSFWSIFSSRVDRKSFVIVLRISEAMNTTS